MYNFEYRFYFLL